MSPRSKWKRTLQVRRDAVLRQAQDQGLATTARFATRLLGERPAPERGAFAPWQREVLRAVIDRMCRYEAPDMPPPSQCGALEATLEFIAWMPEESRAALSDVLCVVEAAPYVFGPTPARFTRLEPAAQDAYLEGWASSSLPPRRALFRALKSSCMIGYWSRPQTWGAIGYGIDTNPGVPEARHREFGAAPGAARDEGEGDES